MGTSKGYEPPQGKGSPWDSLKRQLGRLIDQPEKKDKVVRKFIEALGGSESFSRYNKPVRIPSGGSSSSFKSTAAKKTAQDVTSLFIDINNDGLEKALEDRGLDLEGKNVEEVKEEIIDYFLKPTIDSDNDAANRAVTEVLEEIFSGITSDDDLEEYLRGVVTSDNAKKIVCNFYEKYIYELFKRIFFEDRTRHSNQGDAVEILDIVKETIHMKISNFECTNNIMDIDFHGEEGEQFVQGTLQNMLELLEEEENV